MKHRWVARATTVAVVVMVSCVFLVSCAERVEAEPERLKLDPDHLTVSFLVEHIGYAKVLGMFLKAEGHFDFDAASERISDVRVVVHTESVFTNQPARDRHLKSADFLDVESHPEMVFEAEQSVLSDRAGKLEGHLTLRGVTKPLSLDVTWNRTAPSPLGEGADGQKPVVTGMSARGTLKRSEFGMDYGVADGLVGDEVEILIEFEAKHP